MLLEGTEVCCAPMLDLAEAAAHPHKAALCRFVEIEGWRQPTPAPRLLRTPARPPAAGALCGKHTDEVSKELGLRSQGAPLVNKPLT